MNKFDLIGQKQSVFEQTHTHTHKKGKKISRPRNAIITEERTKMKESPGLLERQ